ncbi:MAG: IS66 family insertion sequence element accessory protein TnpB [Polyangiaceae bacterium]|nr:IS66 family insertion sequence element accessory protein TnpB [Polyangiaceae bacterium]
MIGSTRQLSVYAYRAPVDMRKSFDALTALVVQQLGRDVLSGDMFLFVNRRRKRAKVLFWDGTGLCLFAKRLEKGLFAAPWSSEGQGPVTITVTELALLLEGSELVTKVPLSPAPWVPGERALRWG